MKSAARYELENRDTEALQYYRNTLEIWKKLPSSILMVERLRVEAKVDALQGKGTRAENYLKEMMNALEVIHMAPYGKNMANLYNDLGCLYRPKDVEESIKSHRKALECCDKYKLGKCEEARNAYYNLGACYTIQRKWEETIKCFEISLKMGTQSATVMQFNTYHSLAIAHQVIRNYDRALQYYHQALITQNKLLTLSQKTLWKVRHNLGLLFAQKEDFDHAIYYLNEAYRFSKNKSTQQYLVHCYQQRDAKRQRPCHSYGHASNKKQTSRGPLTANQQFSNQYKGAPHSHLCDPTYTPPTSSASHLLDKAPNTSSTCLCKTGQHSQSHQPPLAPAHWRVQRQTTTYGPSTVPGSISNHFSSPPELPKVLTKSAPQRSNVPVLKKS